MFDSWKFFVKFCKTMILSNAKAHFYTTDRKASLKVIRESNNLAWLLFFDRNQLQFDSNILLPIHPKMTKKKTLITLIYRKHSTCTYGMTLTQNFISLNKDTTLPTKFENQELKYFWKKFLVCHDQLHLQSSHTSKLKNQPLITITVL